MVMEKHAFALTSSLSCFNYQFLPHCRHLRIKESPTRSSSRPHPLCTCLQGRPTEHPQVSSSGTDSPTIVTSLQCMKKLLNGSLRNTMRKV